MSPKQKRRLIATSLILVGVGAATALALTALSGNVSYLYSPSAVAEKKIEAGTRFRLGGVVAEHSVQRIQGLKVRFAVTDRVHEHVVAYEGILPDLFREGQSVIAHGQLGDDGIFHANKILAKHDETYMPAEVMDAMRRAQDQRDSEPGTGGSEAPRAERSSGADAVPASAAYGRSTTNDPSGEPQPLGAASR